MYNNIYHPIYNNNNNYASNPFRMELITSDSEDESSDFDNVLPTSQNNNNVPINNLYTPSSSIETHSQDTDIDEIEFVIYNELKESELKNIIQTLNVTKSQKLYDDLLACKSDIRKVFLEIKKDVRDVDIVNHLNLMFDFLEFKLSKTNGQPTVKSLILKDELIQSLDQVNKIFLENEYYDPISKLAIWINFFLKRKPRTDQLTMFIRIDLSILRQVNYRNDSSAFFKYLNKGRDKSEYKQISEILCGHEDQIRQLVTDNENWLTPINENDDLTEKQQTLIWFKKFYEIFLKKDRVSNSTQDVKKRKKKQYINLRTFSPSTPDLKLNSVDSHITPNYFHGLPQVNKPNASNHPPMNRVITLVPSNDQPAVNNTGSNQEKPRQNTSQGLPPVASLGTRPLVHKKYLKGMNKTLQNTFSSSVNPSPKICNDQMTLNFSVLGQRIPVNLNEGTSQTSIEISNNKLVLHSYKNTIDQSEKITFIRTGRGLDALIPSMLEGTRLVIVATEPESEFTLQLLGSNIDVLVIHSLENIEPGDLGLSGSRWFAIFVAAYHLEVSNFMIMDDNIQSVKYHKGITNDTAANWNTIYETYAKAAEDFDCVVISSASERPEHKKNMASTEKVDVNTKTHGYKLFYVDCEKLRNYIKDQTLLVPKDPRWLLQDIFLQEVIRQAGGKVGKLSYQNLVLERSKKFRNSTAKKSKEKDLSANDWIDAYKSFIDDQMNYPEFYINAYTRMSEFVISSIERYKKQNDSLQNMDLSKITKFLVKDFLTNEEGQETVQQSDRVEAKKGAKNKGNKPADPMEINLEVPNDNSQLDSNFKEFFKTAIDEYLSQPGNLTQLRTPQQDALKNFSDFLGGDEGNMAYYNIATGVGKTKIFAVIANALLKNLNALDVNHSNRKHILIITPTIDINGKTYSDNDFAKGDIIRIDSQAIGQNLFKKNKFLKDPTKERKIGTICDKSFIELIKTDEGKTTLNYFGLIIVDEMHLINESTLQYIKNHTNSQKSIALGFSATPEKTKEYFSHCLLNYTPHLGVKDGYLTPWNVHLLPEGAFENIKTIKNTVGDILRNLQPFSSNSNNDNVIERQGIIWVRKIEQANDLANYINENIAKYKGKASPYHSKLSNRERESLKQLYSQKQKLILVAINTLREGVNFENASWCIIAKQDFDFNFYNQMRGRVLRVAEGKEFADIFYSRNAIIDEEKLKSQIHYHIDEEQNSDQSYLTKRKGLRQLTNDQVPSTKVQKTVEQPLGPQWRAIPFPIGTSLSKALKLSNILINGQHDALIDKLNTFIYPSGKLNMDKRNYLRFLKDNIQYAENSIEADYQSFLSEVQKKDFNHVKIRPYMLYEQKNGVYTYLPNSSYADANSIKILYKQRPNPAQKDQLIDHYELLLHFKK